MFKGKLGNRIYYGKAERIIYLVNKLTQLIFLPLVFKLYCIFDTTRVIILYLRYHSCNYITFILFSYV